ncbi:MAG: hypothetical protein WC789_01340 [Lentisphaeria bacterium]|jgi:hypothetical protein
MKPAWNDIRTALRARHAIPHRPAEPGWRERLHHRLERQPPAFAPATATGLRFALAAIVLAGAIFAAAVILHFEATERPAAHAAAAAATGPAVELLALGDDCTGVIIVEDPAGRATLVLLAGLE